MNPDASRAALREWVARTSGKVLAADLRDDTPILEERLVTSAHLLDLVLYLEQLRGAPIDATRLRPGVFRSIDSICRHLLPG